MSASLDRASEEAIDWMVRLRAGHIEPQQQARFERWLASDPSHADAWARLQERLGGHYDTLRNLERRAPGQAGEARKVLLQPATSRRDVLRGLVGVGLFGGGLWLAARSQPGQALLADLHTGNQRGRFTLADGSQLSLNAGSAVDLDFDASRRLLHLRHGELVVQVAPDAARPFIVRSAQGDIRALGTRFLVRQDEQATRVVVLEHAVRLSLRSGASSADLQQGDAALLHPTRIELLGSGQLHRADWLDGRLSVLDEPLGSVIDALRPYQPGLIRVAPAVRDLRVQGVFLLDDPQRTLTALAETLPIRVERYGPWLTLLGPRE